MRKPASTALFLITLSCISAAAHAQFAWLDEKGQRVYSDQPPPPSVPDAKILRAPHGADRKPPEPDTAPAAKAPPAPADGMSDARKLHDEAEKAVARAEAADKRAACDLAKSNKEKVESGRPIRGAGSAFLTDDEKAQKLAEFNKTLKDCH